MFGRLRRSDDDEAAADPPQMVEAAFVPLWSSEIIRVALEDAGIISSIIEQRLVPAQGMPMARVFVPEDHLTRARIIVDDVMVR